MPGEDSAYLVLPPRAYWREALLDGYLRVLSREEATRIRDEWRDQHGYAAVVVELVPLPDEPPGV